MDWWVILLIILAIFIVGFIYIIPIIKKKKVRQEVLKKIEQREEFTPQDFLIMYNKIKKNKIKVNSIDQPGCYVFLNKTKNMNYVGQSINVLKRINQHLNGKGNGDVYADYKYGVRVCNIYC